MAYVPLVPGQMTATVVDGALQDFKSSAVRDFAGEVVDLSAWDSLDAYLMPSSPNPSGTNGTAIGSCVGDANGIVTLTAGNDSGRPLGTARLIILGKNASGDANKQLVVSGSVTITAGHTGA